MTIDLKREVGRALGTEWPGFAVLHPRLAAAIEQATLVAPAMRGLREDREYVESMQIALALGAGGEIVFDIIRRHVRQWLRRLV